MKTLWTILISLLLVMPILGRPAGATPTVCSPEFVQAAKESIWSLAFARYAHVRWLEIIQRPDFPPERVSTVGDEAWQRMWIGVYDQAFGDVLWPIVEFCEGGR